MNNFSRVSCFFCCYISIFSTCSGVVQPILCLIVPNSIFAFHSKLSLYNDLMMLQLPFFMVKMKKTGVAVDWCLVSKGASSSRRSPSRRLKPSQIRTPREPRRAVTQVEYAFMAAFLSNFSKAKLTIFRFFVLFFFYSQTILNS